MSSSTDLVRRSYDPAVVAVSGPDQNKFVQIVGPYTRPADEEPEEGDEGLVVVRLTYKGNQALYELCHTADQKEVWRFPSYEFVIQKGAVTAAQVKTGRPSYVNAILIASRGLPQKKRCKHNSGWVFVDSVRVPGYWGGSCPGCKWKDHAAECSYATKGEPKYVPANMVNTPRLAIEELED